MTMQAERIPIRPGVGSDVSWWSLRRTHQHFKTMTDEEIFAYMREDKRTGIDPFPQMVAYLEARRPCYPAGTPEEQIVYDFVVDFAED